MTKNYTVKYDWGSEFPKGEKLPQNSNSYSSEQQAKAAVAKKYTSTTSIKGQKGGKNGTWTFSGWDTGRLINDTTVEMCIRDRYRVVEVEAPYGYVLNPNEQKVTFTYVDDKTPLSSF